jgi:aspartate ammonia-lyase
MKEEAMDDTIRQLESCDILDGLDRSVVELLAPVVRHRVLESGNDLFRPGEPRRAFFVIVSGQVEVRVERGEASGTMVVLGPGAGIGEASLLDPSLHTAAARALTRCELLELPADEVRERLVEDGAAAIAVLTSIANVMNRRLRYARAVRTGWEEVYQSGKTRTEHDLLGDREVPDDALYGIQTQRAVENFPITDIRLAHFPLLLQSLAMVKQAAARANHELGLLPVDVKEAIDTVCQEIIDGHWHGHFVVDVVQGGAGTSTNMNANEVIANRALELLGFARGDYQHCHPNNHVNLSQSTNDAYPTSVRVATIFKQRQLYEALAELREALSAKGRELHSVLKMGRTQLQDAVPMTIGQELEAFAVTTGEDMARLQENAALFLEINLGGTAIGTGINADLRYPELAVAKLCEISGLDLVLAENLVEATPDTGAFVIFSGALKRIAVKLSKLCNDLRLLSSGPRCGFNEINLPAMQPGSSIMPGKVNPVIPEVVNQVAFQVIGNDLSITMAAEAGQLQLNAMEPIITFNLFESLDMLEAAVRTLTARCIRGITANEERCRELVEGSIGIVTALVPVLGYEVTSGIAKQALTTGRPVRELLLESGVLSPGALDRLLSPESMTRLTPLKE